MSSLREKKTRQYLMRFTPSMYDKLEKEAKKRGVDVSVLIREGTHLLLEGVPEISDPTEETEVGEVPLLGYICAGDGADIRPLAPGATVRNYFNFTGDVYALIVDGKSMEDEFQDDIKDGSYAYFQKGINPLHKGIVHVEIADAHGERQCFIKRFVPQPNGKTVKFQSLNKDFQDIVCKNGEYEIMGAFLRAWSEEVEAKTYTHEEVMDKIEETRQIIAAPSKGGEAKPERKTA